LAVLFVSHSRSDDAVATALEAWLLANGFTDIFIDHHAIAGGDKWREALRAASSACRVVICLVTPNWLASSECFHEFGTAWYMGKRLVPLFLLPQSANLDGEAKTRFARVTGEDQGIDLLPCIDATGALHLDADPSVTSRLAIGLRAAGALARVGLDPEAFEIDRKLRPTPFPGLASFGDDDADAALFYGRSREIAHTLEELRAMRAKRDQRPLVILGASGAGKSSLLKAGIIPRLRREAPAWLPLRAFRPGADPLLNFAEALSRTFADFGCSEAHGLIRDRLMHVCSHAGRSERRDLTGSGQKALETVLEAEGQELRNVAGRPGASILISVDQAEELARADGSSGEALADYLRVALASTVSPWQLAFTIRADNFHELQSHRRFQNLEARGYDLRALPVFRFDTVVVEPAKRYGVRIDDVLVDALIEDAPKEDALPLLAFALQRLWRQYAASGYLTKENYDKLGGLQGLIEDAAERALRGIELGQDVPVPSGAPLKRQTDLGAVTFVPALAQINDQGAIIKRIAAWKDFSDDSRNLLARFDHWRLVVRKGQEADGGTVEVSHEALFREWNRLKDEWLKPERTRLEALRSLQIDAGTWDRNGRDRTFLNHRDKRLAKAVALKADAEYQKRLTNIEFEYLAACEKAEAAAKARARRTQSVIYALLIGIIFGFIIVINQTYVMEQLNWYMTMRPYMLSEFRPYVLTAAAERALQPLMSFRECAKDCPEMIVVPAGSFTMGSPETEKGGSKNEGPQQQIKIAQQFAVAKYDVTFAEWDACAAVGGCPQATDSAFGRATRPVINVSWNEAKQYAAWLSQMTGQPYRLLSEAEFEYAARAGTVTAYPWGDEIGKGNANCQGCGSQGDRRETSPVGSFKPNAFGLFDMHGNVWNWTEDCYKRNLGSVPADGSPRSAATCESRVIRSGSWYVGPGSLRSAFRGRGAPDFRDNDIGFRVGRTLTP
jgi:formylglycine-generating enzyme required for sulfatase activity